MPTIKAVREALPPYLNERIKIKQRQGTNDIENEILLTHQDCETDYDRIYRLFDLGDIDATAKGIFDFMKGNFVYKAEADDQTVKSPAAIVHPGEYVDCKHYSLFGGGVLDAIKQNEGDPWEWCYRFVSETKDPRPTHVFVVIKNKGKEIWIDPVLTYFNQRKHYTHIKDLQPMALYRINGTDDGKDLTVDDVNLGDAANSFLIMVNANMFSLKELFKRHPEIVNTKVKSWYQKNGLDFNQLLNFINS